MKKRDDVIVLFKTEDEKISVGYRVKSLRGTREVTIASYATVQNEG